MRDLKCLLRLWRRSNRLKFEGSCHCGAVTFEIETTIEPYTCDCSLCSRRGAVMTNVHESALKIVSGQDSLAEYQWNTRIAKHYFCRACGVYPFHRKRSMPDHFGVNLGCLHGVKLDGVQPRAAPGVDMPIVDPHARQDWPGPRVL